MRTSRVVLAFAATAALGLSACSSPTSEEKTAAACTAVTQLQAAVEQVSGLTASSTVEQAQAAKKALTEASSTLDQALSAVAEDRAKAVTEAKDQLVSSLNDAEKGSSLKDAAASLQEEATALRSAVQSAGESISCPA